MKKLVSLVAVVLWAVGIVACGVAGPDQSSAGVEKPGEAEQFLCAPPKVRCYACGHMSCYDDSSGDGCPSCEIVNGHCECF
jgi:hypothetical protein